MNYVQQQNHEQNVKKEISLNQQVNVQHVARKTIVLIVMNPEIIVHNVNKDFSQMERNVLHVQQLEPKTIVIQQPEQQKTKGVLKDIIQMEQIVIHVPQLEQQMIVIQHQEQSIKQMDVYQDIIKKERNVYHVIPMQQ